MGPYGPMLEFWGLGACHITDARDKGEGWEHVPIPTLGYRGEGRWGIGGTGIWRAKGLGYRRGGWYVG